MFKRHHDNQLLIVKLNIKLKLNTMNIYIIILVLSIIGLIVIGKRIINLINDCDKSIDCSDDDSDDELESLN